MYTVINYIIRIHKIEESLEKLYRTLYKQSRTKDENHA
jgi:hypothetical protein